MRSQQSVLFGQDLFSVECLPPPPGRTWATKDREQMRAVMSEYDIARAFVPRPAFNGLVVEPEGERIVADIDENHELVTTSCPLEGYEIGPGEALISAAGGCMFIVAMGRALDGRMRMIVSHAGRDSLIDRNRMMRECYGPPELLEEEPERPYEGVLYAIVETFQRWSIGVHRLEVQGFFSLPASVFLHPLNHTKYLMSNAAMLTCIQKRWGNEAAYEVDDPEEGRCIAVSLSKLFLAQARELHIAHIGCHPDIAADGRLAHTRHPDPEMRTKRNCIIFKNIYRGPGWGHN
ncbi:MAG: hypothetical protein A2854_02495 [Parcubacteria group bacterium RIFCSPHIGHO2_01_FULL_56_18]|nr:MAG: hypothetical protein A2854_02495 [Parcubacteria group bacterium RIFCSPHIGHO2_01_FULL_56_18]